MSRVEASLEEARTPHRQRTRAYRSRNRLRRDMLKDNPFFELFVSGSSTGSDKHFYCMICHRDVSMESRGAGEFSRHFFGKRHWLLDITYRVQNNLPTYNRLMDPMDLSGTQIDEYMNPEDLLPACTQVDSSIPLMTLINCLLELLRSRGSYTLLRKLWGCFRATLGPEDPLFNLNWSRPENLVSVFFDCFGCLGGGGGVKEKRIK